MIIFKFGGASVKDAASIRNLLSILRDYRDQSLFVVVSAMGKMTNQLELLAKESYNRGSMAREIFYSIEEFHENISIDLLGQQVPSLRSLFTTLESNCQKTFMPFDAYYDQIVPFGELLSSRLIADFLATELEIEWLDARDLIITNNNHRKAEIDWLRTEERIKNISAERESIKLTQGFIGATKEGISTTLGREGSDFSAAIFGKFLSASQVAFWKDVPGIMNADPKLFQNAAKFDSLSYREATEMTYYGAKVIHPKTLKPLSDAGISLTVKSFLAPMEAGTSISDQEPGINLPTYVFRHRQTLVTLRDREDTLTNEKRLIEILGLLDELDVRLNLMQISALTFSFVMDQDSELINRIHEIFQESCEVYHNAGLHLATVKNFTSESLKALPDYEVMYIEQITRHNYQRLYSPSGG